MKRARLRAAEAARKVRAPRRRGRGDGHRVQDMRWWKRCILTIALAGVLLAAQYVVGIWWMPPHMYYEPMQGNALVRANHSYRADARELWWMTFDEGPSGAGSSTLAYGWPLPMVRCVVLHGSGRPTVGFKGTAFRSPSLRMPAGVPSDVLWRGLAGNLAFWFLPALIGVSGFLWVRSRFRRSRGRRTKCAYDMRGIGSVCPECGTAAP